MNIVVTAKMRARENGRMFGTGMRKRTNALGDAVHSAAGTSARSATSGSRQKFARMRRNDVPLRPGRTQKGMASGLRWIAKGTRVEFDIRDATAKYPYWLIQEIGSAGDATIRRAEQPNPKGRPKAGAEYVKHVPSQVGRRIHVGLVFGTAAGGHWRAPKRGGGRQNLYWASTLTGVPSPRSGIIIKREIKAQGMVRCGGEAGAKVYFAAVKNAGNEAFGGYPRV